MEGSYKRPGGFAENPNARSKTITLAEGENTYGALNRHPAQPHSASSMFPSYRVGVSEDRNKKCRRTMEDSHSFVYDFGGVVGQGYFAVFDGHAGKHAAEWCGQNFHEFLLDGVITNPHTPIPDLLNKTFHAVDRRLFQLAEEDRTHSGCTAVTAFLRVEEDDEQANDQGGPAKGFTNPGIKSRGLLEGKGIEELERLTSAGGGSKATIGGAASSTQNQDESISSGSASVQRRSSRKMIKDFVKGLTGGKESSSSGDSGSATGSGRDGNGSLETIPDGTPSPLAREGSMPIADGHHMVDLVEPKSEKPLRRVLYTANVGDARAVLCRGGKAVRLTYDHKGSDAHEAKRITDAGGFVMNNRVNGVLAVTRSLGDSSMKEFVVGAPYTTETALDSDDEFLIVACDGLWDVTDDQTAVDLIRKVEDAQEASRVLLDYAITNYSTDNLSVMVVRFK